MKASSSVPRVAGNAALAAGGVALFEGSRILARRPMRAVEERLFRGANNASDQLRIPVRSIMQAGTFATVPIVSVVVGLAGHRRVAAETALSGTAAWVLAKAAKPLCGRPRPGQLLGAVRTRERIAGDLGWLSGHTAVSTTLALTLAPLLPAHVRPVLVAVVVTTAFGRMYVGAHLPLDLVGGAGLGMIIASAARAADSLVRPPA
jgi:membrane-associated phospholipid phosphatase